MVDLEHRADDPPRPVGVRSAVRARARVCVVDPLTMGIRALTTAALVGASSGAGLRALLLGGPWIGHATRNVCRDRLGEAPQAVAPIDGARTLQARPASND